MRGGGGRQVVIGRDVVGGLRLRFLVLLSYPIISYRTWERRRRGWWLLGGVGMFGMVVVVVVDVGWSPLVRSGIRRRRGANYISFFV